VTRGIVLQLSGAQIATRARYLGGLATADELDPFVRSPAPKMIDGYYLLDGSKARNGNSDPTAPDPWSRWSEDGSTFVNRTADCVAGASWCGGWDRYQPKRFAHIYKGSINTNSIPLDARGPALCFVELDRPEPGCFMNAPTGAPGAFAGCGHIATVYEVPLEWDPENEDCWFRVKAVDIASRTPRPANAPTTGRPWWFARRSVAARTKTPHLYAAFYRSIMVP